MNNLSGGYIMVDLSSPNKVKQLAKAVALNKPLLVYYQDGTTEWGKVTVTYETVDDVEVPTYHITTANGFVTVEADGDIAARPLILEGDGVPIEQEGITISYCKWSLSGTHLMCVIAGNVTAGTEIASSTVLASFMLPDYILNKVYPTQGTLIYYFAIAFVGTNYQITNIQSFIDKTGTAIRIKTNGSYSTQTVDKSFRAQVDLLIDNE